MKKKMYIALLLIAGIIAVFLFGTQVIKKANQNKPSVALTVYTISSSDTKKWNKVKQFETKEAIYQVKVKEASSSKEVFANIIADGMAVGFGVSEEDVKQFNHNLDSTIEDAKHNKLIGIDFITFSDVDEGFVVANFDYGKEAFNSQKKENKALYRQLYKAFKK
ncbi:hypothetical protein [Streptococcus halichoeri]|uniref:hypothetical protein n=1 Tax=Streptococcus halichoeri TaxID=254785 RepID=UPI001359E772|nr:hypothetical protein [Streptococcus halichoeri]